MSADAFSIFNPDVMNGAMQVAKQIAQSTIIPRALQGKPGDVLVVLLTGREFGLQPMQAMRMLHVVDGKPVMAADLMVGLCLGRREVCEYFVLVESTADRATYKTKRVGTQEVVLTWTMKQAQTAGVTNKDNWRKYPDAMLRARCASALARAVYPDLMAGTYDPDELDVSAAPPMSDRAPSSPIGETRPVLERAALPAKSASAEASEVMAGMLKRAEPEAVPVAAPREATQEKAAEAPPVVTEEMGLESDAICAEAEALEGFDNAGYAKLAERAKNLPKGSVERKNAANALTAAKRRMDAFRAEAVEKAKATMANGQREPGED